MAVGCVQDMDPGASTSVIQPPDGLLRYCWQVPTTQLSAPHALAPMDHSDLVDLVSGEKKKGKKR